MDQDEEFQEVISENSRLLIVINKFLKDVVVDNNYATGFIDPVTDAESHMDKFMEAFHQAGTTQFVVRSYHKRDTRNKNAEKKKAADRQGDVNAEVSPPLTFDGADIVTFAPVIPADGNSEHILEAVECQDPCSDLIQGVKEKIETIETQEVPDLIEEEEDAIDLEEPNADGNEGSPEASTSTKTKVKRAKRQARWHHATVPISGVPFVVDGVKYYGCAHGHDLKEKKKLQLRNEAVQELDEEVVVSQRKRRKFITETKKVNCDAGIAMRELTIYHEHYLGPKDLKKENLRRRNMAALRKQIEEGTAKSVRRLVVKVPLVEAHSNHPIGANSGIAQRVHPAIRRKIYEYVTDGVTDQRKMRSQLRQYVLNELCRNAIVSPSLENRSYFPTQIDIKNHVARAVTLQQTSKYKLYHLVLEGKVKEWETAQPGCRIFYKKMNAENGDDALGEDIEPSDPTKPPDFIFLYQAKWQQDLLKECGDICFLDAVHLTTDYPFPLYFLHVRVRLNLRVAAIFIVQPESKENIALVIEFLKAWNPGWNPTCVSVDLFSCIISAVADTFPQCNVVVSEVQRDRTIEGWVKTHGGGEEKTPHLSAALKAVVFKPNNESAVDQVRASHLYRDNLAFAVWVEDSLLGHANKWAVADPDMQVIPKANVVRVFKHQALPHGPESSLISSLTYIINEFLTDQHQKYSMNGITRLKSYSVSIPEYLHNRPTAFVKKCMENLRRAQSYTDADVMLITQDNPSFLTPVGLTFQVRSESALSGWFLVNIETPSCECGTWQRTNNPCEHIFAIFKIYPQFGWNTFSETYRNQARFQPLKTFAKKGITQQDDSAEDQNSPENETASTSTPVVKEELRERERIAKVLSTVSNATVPKTIAASKRMTENNASKKDEGPVVKKRKGKRGRPRGSTKVVANEIQDNDDLNEGEFSEHLNVIFSTIPSQKDHSQDPIMANARKSSRIKQKRDHKASDPNEILVHIPDGLLKNCPADQRKLVNQSHEILAQCIAYSHLCPDNVNLGKALSLFSKGLGLLQTGTETKKDCTSEVTNVNQSNHENSELLNQPGDEPLNIVTVTVEEVQDRNSDGSHAVSDQSKNEPEQIEYTCTESVPEPLENSEIVHEEIENVNTIEVHIEKGDTQEGDTPQHTLDGVNLFQVLQLAGIQIENT